MNLCLIQMFVVLFHYSPQRHQSNIRITVRVSTGNHTSQYWTCTWTWRQAEMRVTGQQGAPSSRGWLRGSGGALNGWGVRRRQGRDTETHWAGCSIQRTSGSPVTRSSSRWRTQTLRTLRVTAFVWVSGIICWRTSFSSRTAAAAAAGKNLSQYYGLVQITVSLAHPVGHCVLSAWTIYCVRRRTRRPAPRSVTCQVLRQVNVGRCALPLVRHPAARF